MEKIRSSFRQVRRLVFLGFSFLFAALDNILRLGYRWEPMRRSIWMRKWATIMTRIMGFEIRVIGKPPKSGFIAPNHLGYMDIVVLGTVVPQTFLSKQEVSNWPVIGALTRMAGTLYIDRAKRSDVANKEEDFSKVIDAGVGMTFFLEGTSSDGSEILPFRASLLGSVVKNHWPVTPAYLKYECDGGDPRHDVCWWGEMSFGAHLKKMATLKRIRATVVFGETRYPGDDRKILADQLRFDVVSLRDRFENGSLENAIQSF